jgi:hypothetical protein
MPKIKLGIMLWAVVDSHYNYTLHTTHYTLHTKHYTLHTTGEKMAITYDDVALACAALLAEGIPLSITSVRTKLKGGSQTTIQPLLKEWRANVPKTPAPALVEIPSSVAKELSIWLRSYSASARAEIESKLAETESDAVELLRSGKAVEKEFAELKDQLTAMTSAHDAAEAIAQERKFDVERLTIEVEKERKACNAATRDIATWQFQTERQTVELNTLKTMLMNFEKINEEFRDAKTEAEKIAAVAIANCDAVQKSADERAEALTTTQRRLDTAHESIENLRANHASQIKFERDNVDRLTTENMALVARWSTYKPKVPFGRKGHALREAPKV